MKKSPDDWWYDSIINVIHILEDIDHMMNDARLRKLDINTPEFDLIRMKIKEALKELR